MENWDDLRIFLTVAQAGSLTVAAQVLKIDPATVVAELPGWSKPMQRRFFQNLQRAMS